MKSILKPTMISLCLLGACSVAFAQPVSPASQDSAAIKKLENSVARQQKEINELKAKAPLAASRKAASKEDVEPSYKNALQYGGVIYGGSSVRIGPFLGDSPAPDGSGLVVNNHSVNQDRQLLHMRQAEDAAMKAKDPIALPGTPRLIFSGKVEGQASYIKNNSFKSGSQSDIDLTGVELDSFVETSPWIGGFLGLDYDNSPLTSGVPGSENRLNNSRIFVNKAFILIGNFEKSPFYSSVGQLYVPFGQFSSGLVSSPLTQLMGRVKARAITLNYASPDKDGVFGSVYGFKSYMLANNNINSGGANLGYQFNNAAGWSGRVAGGVISNVAEAEGNFSEMSSGFKLAHAVPGADVNAQVSKGPFSVMAEYVATTRAYAPADMTFDDGKAKPTAAHLESDYSFGSDAMPQSIAIAGDVTRQALGLGLPHYRVSAAYNISLWRDTVESFEVRHDVDYGTNSSTTGAASTAGSGTGKSLNALFAQMDVYF